MWEIVCNTMLNMIIQYGWEPFPIPRMFIGFETVPESLFYLLVSFSLVCERKDTSLSLNSFTLWYRGCCGYFIIWPEIQVQLYIRKYFLIFLRKKLLKRKYHNPSKNILSAKNILKIYWIELARVDSQFPYNL